MIDYKKSFEYMCDYLTCDNCPSAKFVSNGYNEFNVCQEDCTDSERKEKLIKYFSKESE